MKIKVKELIKLLETLDQEAIINGIDINPFDSKRNTLDVYILEDYQKIENGVKYNITKYKINYSEGTIELQYSQPTNELYVRLNSSDDWKDCMVYSRNIMKNAIKLGE